MWGENSEFEKKKIKNIETDMAGAGGNPFGDDEETGENPFGEDDDDVGKNPFGDDEEQINNNNTTPVKTAFKKVGARPRKAAAPPPPSSATSTTRPSATTTESSEPTPVNSAVRKESVLSVTPKIKAKTSTVSIVKSLIPVEESTAQHHELFLQEIEAVDEYWGPTFRGVYESGQHEMFLERLEERIKKHDKDIEKMCSHHYQGFIESVRDLLRVRSQATQLKKEVETVDKEMRLSCRKVLSGSEQLVRARNTETNISSTIQSLSLCLPVLQMFSKLSKQMRDKRYHPALKTLEQLEQNHLPKIANYRFSKQMREQIPHLREDIKQSSMADLKDFLENIRKFSPKMGEIAMRHALEQMEVDIGGEKEGYEALSESTYDTEEDLSAPDLVDFGPVYRCLHIYTVLGERETYERYYRKQRAQQCALTLTPPNNMHEDVDGYRTYFHNIVGFFVCEDHILNTGGGLVSKGYLEEVWSGATTKIVATLRTHTAYCTDAALMLKIKNLVMLFASTLKTYGYNVERLYELLQELRDHYNEVLMQRSVHFIVIFEVHQDVFSIIQCFRWVVQFRDIFEADNYHPIEVTSLLEYQDITSTFPYENSSLESAVFPKQFPFSAMVPRVYTEVQEFIISCLQFSEDLQLTQAELG